MGIPNDGFPFLCQSDYSVSQILLETSGSDLEQFMDTTADDSFEIFHFEEEFVSNNITPMKEFSAEQAFQMLDDFSAPPAQCSQAMPMPMPMPMPTNENALSCEEIMKLAGTQFMRASANGGFDHAHEFAIAAMRKEEHDGLELAHLLLSSAEMIGKQQFDQAARLVWQCKNFSSQVGNPIQRLAYYVSDALHERIERETMGEISKATKPVPDFAFNFDTKTEECDFFSLVALYNRLLPYVKVMQFTSTQAIIDAVGKAKKIHVIDLGMRTGSQWTVLIQFLAERAAAYSSSSNSSSLELLTITAVGMNGEQLKKGGRRLHEFAKSLAVPFAYKMVKISNMEEIHEGLFHIKSGEAVAVNASIVLRSLLYDPVLLDNLVTVIKKLRPRIMVNAELEGQQNSPSFVNRFIEVLFYNSTYFDLLDVTFPDRNDVNRVKHEEIFVAPQIRNMIVCEGKDRRVRHVKTEVWRCFFKQAGFKESSFSFQAKYQARLLLNQFPCGELYTLEPNGSAIILGWKGTPLFGFSAWSCKK